MSYKICIYAICKNELSFVNQWLDNVAEADYIVVLDTGSTDGTYEALQKDPRITRVEQKVYEQFRFDAARNDSMELIPEDADILVCTDFDELFEPGWADILRNNWSQDYNRAHYLYIWQHNDQGEPQDTFIYDKVHTRDFYWLYPVHEVLVPKEGIVNFFLEMADQITLHHWQDKTKDRKSYEPLLKISCEEHPTDSHVHFLYAREKLLYNKYDEAIEEYLKVLKMPDIKEPNRRLVLLDAHYQIAQCFFAIGNYWETLSYCQDFIYLDSTYRDPYFLMAEAYLSLTLNTLAEATVKAGFEYGIKHNDWVETANSWLGWGYDILARAQCQLDKIDDAITTIAAAVQHEPNDIRLLKFYNSLLQDAYQRMKASN